jgi:hypothetical protein
MFIFNILSVIFWVPISFGFSNLVLIQVPPEVQFMVYFFCHGFSFFHCFTLLWGRPKWTQLILFFVIFMYCAKTGKELEKYHKKGTY